MAFGAVGNPIRTLVAVTGLGEADISAMIGRILPFTALILPFWLIRSVTNWASTLPVWPGLLLCGGVFAAVFLAFAVPGIPRGAFIMLTPLFLAIGLPAEGIGLLIAVDAIPDVFSTVLNVTGDLAAAALVARGEE